MLEVLQAQKVYGSTVALDGLSLTARAGAVTGIAGPNGAGKSTLVKVLAGETRLTRGVIRLDGDIQDQDGLSRITAVVHQEPQLFPTMTVADNLLVGREGRRALRPRAGLKESRLLKEFGLEDYAFAPVRDVPIAVRQRTEIARALAREARIFLFDEPNSALTEQESGELFDQVRGLADRGHVVLFVSHRLRELAHISDEIAVVKNGRTVSMLTGTSLTESALAKEMIESSKDAVELRRRPADDEQPALSGLALDGWFDRGVYDVRAASVRRGEILAVLGVEGSGAREFVAAVGGFGGRATTGEMRWAGKRTRPARCSAFVPASRQDSVLDTLTTGSCLVARLAPSRIAGPHGLVRTRESQRIATELITEYGIRCSNVDQPVSELSGGNQQKVIIASAVASDPQVLVVEEPTRGVDIQSRYEIYALLRGFVNRGHAAIVFCTEETEAFEVADACLVFAGHSVAGRIELSEVGSVRELVDAIADLEETAAVAAT